MRSCFLKINVLILAVLAVAGCGKNERPEYQGADYYKSLELPPDLNLEKSAAEMDIPEPTVSALEDFQSRHKLNKAVAPEFRGIRLKHDGSMYYLEVDAAPEVVWPKVEAFWENEGIRLQQNRPMLGFMQTDWTKQLQVREDANYFVKLFSKMEPDFRDKFRMRIEPAADRTRTHIFVAHYGIEVIVEGPDGEDGTYWRGRKSDIELEREILARLTLFAGLSENQAVSLMQDYKPFQSYVTYKENFQESVDRPDGGKQTRVAELTMKGSMDFVWYRTIRALDRIQMEDISLNKKEGRISFTAPGSTRIADTDEEIDEVAESSWLMNLFTSSKKKDDPKGTEKYILQLIEMPGYISFELQDQRGIEATSARAAQVRAALARALE